jgi:hypothetical protein
MRFARAIAVSTAAAAAGLMCWAPVASATARFASPGGAGEACTQPEPCGIVTAIKKAANNDDITIEPGRYEPEQNLFDETHTLTIHGLAGAPRPVIVSSHNGFLLAGFGSTLRDVEMDVTNLFGAALIAIGPAETAERVVMHTLGSEGFACEAGSTMTLIDSVCVADGLKSTALLFISATPAHATLRNDTLEAPGGSGLGGSVGLETKAEAGREVQATLINTIAHGSRLDLLAAADSNPSSDGVIVAEHSNYATDATESEGGKATVTPHGTGTNQSAAPLFANAGTDDFHELTGSPTIAAGFSSPANGPTDLDGVPRQLGGATDIGAYQFVPAPATSPAPTVTVAALSGSGPPPMLPAPSDSQPVLTPRTFAALARGGSLAKAARGTTVSYTDTQAATTTFIVRRPLGSGVLSHGRCVAPPHGSARRGRRCTRVSTVGTFAHVDVAGPNRFRFTGRVRGRALQPGSYQLVSTPRNAAGKTGATHLNAFKVVAG